MTVVYFMPPPAGKTIVEAYHHEFMGQQAHQDFQVIKLWELEAKQVLAFDNPVLLPFVPLMRGGNTEQMVRKCANRIRQEPKAAELEAILAVFAGYVLEAETIKQILRWEMQVVQDSPIIQELRQEWLEQGREEGIEKGREEGERKAALKALDYTRVELIGKHIRMIYAPECEEKVKEVFQNWKANGTVINEELVIVEKNGGKRIVLLSASAVQLPDSQATSAALIAGGSQPVTSLLCQLLTAYSS